MADKTGISWATSTLNPIRARNKQTGKVGWHCRHVSVACTECYAESLNKRLGTGLPFKPGHEKDIDLYLDEIVLLQALHWKKPRTIFWNSMTDTFGEFVSGEWLEKMFSVMARTPQHVHMLLTKRPERMRKFAQQVHSFGQNWLVAAADGKVWPLPNVWLGVSAEDQATADERIPDLLDTPAAVRFVSAEPLLGPIDFNQEGALWHHSERFREPVKGWPNHPRQKGGLDLIITGGLSGDNWRDHHEYTADWIADIDRQCKEAGVHHFAKQDAARLPGQQGRIPDAIWNSRSVPGGGE